jgi:hypothetical protein
MERKIVIVRNSSGSSRELQNDVDDILRLARDWEVVSATTSIATCLDYNSTVLVQMVTTIVLEKR